MPSQIVKDLHDFAARLSKDGYPTALIERAAIRMEHMERILVEINKANEAIVAGEQSEQDTQR